MRFGLFSTFDNPHGDFAQAYAEQISLVRLAEGLGFDEAWVVEHHFNAESPIPSCLMVLAFLAARTSRIRLGSAATLLPFHNPALIAEEVATLDILSEGRFNFGVAKGGPFPMQNKHFGVDLADSRDKTIEALALIQRLLAEDEVSFDGAYFKTDRLRLTPKPLQRPVPTFIATSTPDMVRRAAALGYGFMAGPPFPLKIVARNVAAYRDAAPQGDPKLVLMRFFHLARTRAQARKEAAELLAPFIERMKSTTARMQPEWTEWFDVERVIDDSLIGTTEEVGDGLRAIETELAPHSVVLKPLSPLASKRSADLEIFSDVIGPLFRTAETI
ncbi:LLM class flavin-dependent oxidoreductase [Methylocella silvestris]|uniref:LLM class flavin-dependent oxidoreductase n=1 Tax=Methylocella silvestris TaxID=199596 RepID=A0A2J7TIS8_METSI|nr:LLM class flavin-dependent oxidoreductase [Methylocella silvestris]PNG26674.1 LLM class flavin-dependent oxidoreductase [Methylocella silvestris]